MFKKIILVVSTFGIICVAYVIYQWRDETAARPAPAPYAQQPHQASRRSTTQPAGSQPEDQTFTFKGARIPPGESPRVTVLDEKGNAKIVFQSARWRPISDNEFHLTYPTARLLLPGGQLAYVWADEGQVALQRGEGNNYNPKSGWLRGHVRIFIDRTRPREREENPDRAGLEQHPEAVIKIWLDDVSFDLDLNRLDSKGAVVVQSVEATLEGEGLELIWSEVDRRVRHLRIAKGRRATMRSSRLAKLTFAGASATEPVVSETTTPETTRPAAPAVAKQAPIADHAITFQDLDDEERLPKADRVDTYRVEFRDGVVAQQKEGAKVVGALNNVNLLEVVCDVGREERAAVENAPGSRPEDAKSARTRPAAGAGELAAAGRFQAPSKSIIELEWSGELLAEPIQTTTQPESGRQERVHVVARGRPVRVRDEQNGEAVCRELEYHGENKQVWLRGTADEPVRMDSASRGMLTAEVVFFDPKAGVARVDGAGRMIAQRQRRSQDPVDGLAAATAGGEISWTRSAILEFARTGPKGDQKATEKQPRATAGNATGTEKPNADGNRRNEGKKRPRSEYIRRAVFEGQVSMRQSDSAIDAGRVEASFLEPQAGAETEGLITSSVTATNRVVFEQKSERKSLAERVTCDRLEVDMDPGAQNLPKVARAFGNIVATQQGARSRREIRATDHLVLNLISVPRPITEEERQRLDVLKLRHPEIKPGSPQWTAMETKLQNRRKTVARSMTADGQVLVRVRDSRDSGRDLDLIADSLDCAFSADEDIERALISGRDDRPASVDTGDVYIKGPRIVIDMPTQYMEVPGAGLMRFLTKEDLDGRQVQNPVPIVVSWKDRMSFRGQENRGTFTGTVRAASESTTLDCRELRIEFKDVQQTATTRPAGARYWVFQPLIGSERDGKATSVTGRLSRQMHKRPVYLWAVGDAVIESSTFERPARRGLVPIMARFLPEAWQPPVKQPTERGRLLSRLRSTGPQIRIDLVQRHFGVEGPGNMSVEDYRLPQGKRSQGGGRPGLLSASGIGGGLDSLGPSQTLFTWQSSMTYLSHRNLARFDDTVRMNHVSGAAMVMKDELAAAMKLDPARLGKMESRQARLDCDNLLVQFDRDPTQREPGPSPLSRATRLQRFEANGTVQLALNQGKQAVTGTILTYVSESGEVRVTGSPSWPAQVLEQDERTGKLNIVRCEPGKSITYNEKTRVARIEGSSLVGTGR